MPRCKASFPQCKSSFPATSALLLFSFLDISRILCARTPKRDLKLPDHIVIISPLSSRIDCWKNICRSLARCNSCSRHMIVHALTLFGLQASNPMEDDSSPLCFHWASWLQLIMISEGSLTADQTLIVIRTAWAKASGACRGTGISNKARRQQTCSGRE